MKKKTPAELLAEALIMDAIVRLSNDRKLIIQALNLSRRYTVVPICDAGDLIGSIEKSMQCLANRIDLDAPMNTHTQCVQLRNEAYARWHESKIED